MARIGGTKEITGEEKTLYEKVKATILYTDNPAEKRYYEHIKQWMDMTVMQIGDIMLKYKDATCRYNVERLLADYGATKGDGTMRLYTDYAGKPVTPQIYDIIYTRIEDWRKWVGAKQWGERQRLADMDKALGNEHIINK